MMKRSWPLTSSLWMLARLTNSTNICFQVLPIFHHFSKAEIIIINISKLNLIRYHYQDSSAVLLYQLINHDHNYYDNINYNACNVFTHCSYDLSICLQWTSTLIVTVTQYHAKLLHVHMHGTATLLLCIALAQLLRKEAV